MFQFGGITPRADIMHATTSEGTRDSPSCDVAYSGKGVKSRRLALPIEQAQVGELLPVVSRHFAEERSLPVDHFIMGKG